MGQSWYPHERDCTGSRPTEGAFSRLLPRPELEELAKERIPLGRFGTLDEFANLATFLISDASSYINGDVVTMDGGEWLQGAGEFTTLGRMLNEKEWEMMRPKKPARPTSGISDLQLRPRGYTEKGSLCSAVEGLCCRLKVFR